MTEEEDGQNKTSQNGFEENNSHLPETESNSTGLSKTSNTNCNDNLPSKPMAEPELDKSTIVPNEQPTKQSEPSNGFDHKPSVNMNHSEPVGILKSSEPNANRVSNGVLTNSVYTNANSKPENDCEAANSIEKPFNFKYNSHNDADFYDSRKGGMPIPQGSPLLATDKQTNHINYFPSSYSISNLDLSIGKSISSNGVPNSTASVDELKVTSDEQINVTEKKSMDNELASQSGAPSTTAPNTAIEASTS